MSILDLLRARAASAITTIPGGPFPAGSTIVYTGQLVDISGDGIPAASITSLTLTLINDAGAVVNSVSNINILNTGRGVVDASGNLTVTLGPADTVVVPTVPSGTQKTTAILLTWVSGTVTGRHQANLTLVALAG